MRFFCSLFGYTKQAYYKVSALTLLEAVEAQQVKTEVLAIRRLMPRIGTRKLHFMLKDTFHARQLKIGREKLFSILRREGLLIIKRKKYTVTTNSRHQFFKYPNLIGDIFIGRPEQVWVSDITYLDTHDGYAYLHLVTDAYSKQIMGYELCDNMAASSTLKALHMALKNRKYPDQPLIHHSDRGLQYCSRLYTQTLNRNNISISMTQNGDPYENAIAERVNGILKDEFGLDRTMEDLNDARKQAAQSILIYNTLRPHISCEMLTPVQMHNQQSIKMKRWKTKSSQADITCEL